jgi:cytochrome c biogenesis protein CcmG, thiol:disulfide interchange protein DsbE
MTTPPEAATPETMPVTQPNWRLRLAIIIPFAVFIGFVIMVAGQLGRPTQEVIHSKMIGQPLPDIRLPGLSAAGYAVPGLAPADFVTGKAVMINVFASWCLPCQAEAPELERLQKMGVTIDAIAVRDAPEDIAGFLGKYGNPFARVGLDTTGKTQIMLGSSGVPETFIVDGKGRIRYQHIGEIRPEDIAELMRQLAEAGE